MVVLVVFLSFYIHLPLVSNSLHFEAVWILAKFVMATLGGLRPTAAAKSYPFLCPIGCGPLFGSEGFADPGWPQATQY